MIESAGSHALAANTDGNAKGDAGVTGTPICVHRISQADEPTRRLYSSCARPAAPVPKAQYWRDTMADAPITQRSDADLFRCSVSFPIRYADVDAQRHLNNVAYFTFMEHARVLYLRELGLWQDWDFESIGMILAETSCTYTAPAYLGETVTVRTRVTHLGTKSFHFEYRLETERGEIATGKSVQVCYDYALQRSIPMPAEWREAMVAFEPGL
jgi:acyl-CoA thioester hydrolase